MGDVQNIDGTVNGNGKLLVQRRTWRRVTLSIFGILIIALQWRWSVNHIYSIAGLHSDVAMTAFVAITQSAFYVIGAIVVFLVTGLTFFSWTQSTSLASSLAAQITKSFTETREVTKSAETEVKR